MKWSFKRKYIHALSLFFIFLDLLIILLSYNKLPDIIPSHFDSDFIPNDYSHRSHIFLLWVIHFVIIGVLNIAYAVIEKKNSLISYIPGLILLAQCCLVIFDSVRTILISIHPKANFNPSLIEYSIIGITLLLLILFYIKNQKKQKNEAT